jgi:hypothetical protein
MLLKFKLNKNQNLNFFIHIILTLTKITILNKTIQNKKVSVKKKIFFGNFFNLQSRVVFSFF